jgi:hypothetical protein
MNELASSVTVCVLPKVPHHRRALVSATNQSADKFNSIASQKIINRLLRASNEMKLSTIFSSIETMKRNYSNLKMANIGNKFAE